MNRPTPETDDLARGNHVVPTEWAEQLEIERNEAREELKKLEGAYEDATNYYARMIELREERDEWRQCAEKLYNSSGWHDEWPTAVQNYKKIKNGK